MTLKKKWNQLITVITDEENKITTASILTGIASYPLFKKITLMQALTKRFPQSIKLLSGKTFWFSLLTAGIGGLATALVMQLKDFNLQKKFTDMTFDQFYKEYIYPESSKSIQIVDPSKAYVRFLKNQELDEAPIREITKIVLARNTQERDKNKQEYTKKLLDKIKNTKNHDLIRKKIEEEEKKKDERELNSILMFIPKEIISLIIQTQPLARKQLINFLKYKENEIINVLAISPYASPNWLEEAFTVMGKNHIQKAVALFFIPADKFSDFKDNIPNNIETLYNNMKEIKIYPNIKYFLVAAQLNPQIALMTTKELAVLGQMSWPDKTDQLILNNSPSKSIAYFTLNKESSKDKK